MNKIKLAALAAVCLLYPLSAACDETSGYYAGLYAGYGKTHDSKLRIEGYPPRTLLFEPSYRLGGIAGYDFAGPLRVDWILPGARPASTGLRRRLSVKLPRSVS